MQVQTKKLIEEHVAHVHRLARGFRFEQSSTFSHDDLVSAGLEALVECAVRYEPERGSVIPFDGTDPFWTWAARRVAGAMQDAIRSWFHWDRGASCPRLAPFDSLERIVEHDDSGDPIMLYDRVASPEPPDAEPALEAVRRLPEREALVCLRRAAGYSIDEIGEDLGVDESRVSQLHRDAFDRFRAWGYIPADAVPGHIQVRGRKD